MAESIWNIYIVHIKYEEIMSMASARRKYHLFSYHIYEPGLSSSPLLCVYHHKALSIHNFFCLNLTSLIVFRFSYVAYTAIDCAVDSAANTVRLIFAVASKTPDNSEIVLYLR